MAARDEAGFEEFVAARSADLLRTAVLLTRDRGHAEDLLQAALVTAYRRWGRIERDDPYPYVRRILVTTAASRRRLRSTQEIVSLPADDPAGPRPHGGRRRARADDRGAGHPAGPHAHRARPPLHRGPQRGGHRRAHGLLGLHRQEPDRARALARLRTALGAAAVVTVLEEC